MKDDPRVTPLGKFMRRFSIDELPQLLNVFLGHMSLVGPRPPLQREVVKYNSWHKKRLRVRPGITGPWQVSGRSLLPFEDMVRLDIYYIENWSLWLDFKILLRTIPVVLAGSGAY
jgi:lipopolysaccharide/colanic/teichoic acid biosynthesis glycosyltransferase